MVIIDTAAGGTKAGELAEARIVLQRDDPALASGSVAARQPRRLSNRKRCMGFDLPLVAPSGNRAARPSDGYLTGHKVVFNDPVGIDLGLKEFAATSDGSKIEAQKFSPA